jgi:hypothetical protein
MACSGSAIKSSGDPDGGSLEIVAGRDPLHGWPEEPIGLGVDAIGLTGPGGPYDQMGRAITAGDDQVRGDAVGGQLGGQLAQVGQDITGIGALV